MEKKMPNKGTYAVGSAGGDRQASTQRIQKGEDLRSKPCQNLGKSKQE
jgi:hypothetical protein